MTGYEITVAITNVQRDIASLNARCDELTAALQSHASVINDAQTKAINAREDLAQLKRDLAPAPATPPVEGATGTPPGPRDGTRARVGP